MVTMRITANQTPSFSEIANQFGQGQGGDHHVRMDEDRTRLYTSKKLSLTGLKAALGFGGAMQAREQKRRDGLEQIKKSIDQEYGEGMAARALARLGLGGDTAIRGRDLSALKNELDNLRAADVLDRAGPVRDAAPVIFNPAADASGMAAIPDPIAAATSPSPVPALIISKSMIETALQNHMLQPLDFSFNNYNKGLPGGVCNGASVVWLNKMAEAGVQRAINIDSDRTVGAEILELQKKFENADLSIADMKGDQALHATRFDPFGEEPLNVAAQFESDGKVDKQTRLLTVEAVAKGIAQKLRSSDDFAFVQLSRGDGNGHACAIFRDAGDKVHFFDPDIGAYSFNADAEGLARLGAKLVDSMTPARNQLTLIFGSM